MVADYAAKLGVHVVLCEVCAKGGAGGEELAREVLALLAAKERRTTSPLYDDGIADPEKIDTIVKRVYGGDGADYSPAADRAIDYLDVDRTR